VLSALSESGPGAFNSFERVVKFPDDAFNAAKVDSCKTQQVSAKTATRINV
jgi:hypothetical protein